MVALAASSKALSLRCAYRSVVVTLLCPSMSLTSVQTRAWVTLLTGPQRQDSCRASCYRSSRSLPKMGDREIVRIQQLQPQDAERRPWELYRQEKAHNRYEHARMCLSQLAMLIDSQGRRRESLMLSIRLVREHSSPSALTSLAYALERRGWVRFARGFFQRALELPDTESLSVRWHDHARAGIMRMEARLRGGWPYPGS